jgi:ribosomal protein S12 methylthiotransferase
MANKSYYFLNLGCPKNRIDGDYIRGRLNRLGLSESAVPDEVDYIIINTCAFIEEARQETKG